MSKQQLLEAIETRCRDLLARLAAGSDLPPGPRLHLEGMLDAARICGYLDAGTWERQLEQWHREMLGCPIAERAGSDWQQLHPFPQLPLYMDRAPVSPSTPD
jgi:hypothetical protein